MNILIGIFILTISRSVCSTRDDVRSTFISNFITNENKPTSLILYNLCWSKDEIMHLAHELVKSGIRISSSYIEKSKYFNDVIFLLDLDCPDAENTLKMAISRKLIRGQFRWLLITNSSEVLQKEVVSELPVLPDSDVVLAVRTGNYFQIDELHRPFLEHSIIATPRGFFNGTLTDVRLRRELFRRRMDLMGYPLTMSNVIQDSNTTQYHLPMENGLEFENDAVAKISWMCAKLGMLMVNATPRYTFAYRWGYKVGDRWSGMIEELKSGRADMGTNCLTSDTRRLAIVAYVDTLAPLQARFIFRQPPLTYVSNIYSLPFTSYVWAGTVICSAISAVAIFVASKWETGFGKGAKQLGNIGDAVFLTMSAVSQQGCVMEPVRASVEIIYLAQELVKTGIRISSSYIKKSKYFNHNVMFFLDLDCPDAEDTLKMAISQKLISSQFRWLLITNSSEGLRKEIVFGLPVLPDSDVVLAVRNGNLFQIDELHRPFLEHSIIATPRGFFNGTFTDVRPRRELFRRRMDLMGHPLTVSNVIQDSNTTQYHLPMEDGLEFQNDAVAKISWMCSKIGILMVNATPRYTFAFRWGFKIGDRWSGMIEELNTGRADMGTNCIINDPQRLAIVAYVDTLAPLQVRFIFRQPPLTYVSNIYSLPFSRYVWAGTALCSAISAVAIFVASRWEAGFGKGATQLDGNIGDAMFLTMSAVSQQGCAMEPVRASGRIMVWFVFVCLMALHAAYSANIVALLQAPSRAITTLPQLAASKITLAANDVDYNYFIFKLIKDPVHVAIRKRVQPDKGKPLFYDIKEGVERIRKGLFAFHSISEPVYRRIEETFLESEKCDLNEIDFMMAFAPYVPMRKDSPYLELIRVAFKRVIETGIRSALNKRYQVPKPKCAGKTSAFSSVGVQDMRAVLALMAVGMSASVAILAVEIIVFKMKKRNIAPPLTRYFRSTKKSHPN